MTRETNAIKLTTILVAAVVIYAFMLCANANEGIAASAKQKSGVLRMLIWEGHAPKSHINRFVNQIEKKYGYKLKLQIKHMDGTDSYYDPIRAGTVDVVMLTHQLLKDERFNFIKNKLLLPLDLKNIPNFKHLSPSLQKAEYLRSNGHVYASPESQGPYGLAYNTSRLKKEPKSWNILWEPQYKGKYVIGANEYLYNVMITAMALGYSKESMESYDALNNPVFKKKLRQLTVNAHSFWIGVDKAEDLSGHLLATAWGDSLKPLKQRGEIWEIVKPAEGTPFWIDNVSITSALANKPFLKKIAEEYINSVLSSDFQVETILRVIGTIPVITKFEAPLTPKEKKRIQTKSSKSSGKGQVMVPTCSRRDRNGLKLLWNQAMKDIPVKSK